MSLYEQWVKMAYDSKGQSVKKFWKEYMPEEQRIYERVLGEKLARFEFTPAELAREFKIPVTYVCGFVDGISEALENEPDVKGLEEDTRVSLDIDFEKLFKKMVELKAKHLYTLAQWEGVFDAETREGFIFEMTKGRVYVRETEKIGRNDPCPCGSGKKYKLCCGA